MATKKTLGITNEIEDLITNAITTEIQSAIEESKSKATKKKGSVNIETDIVITPEMVFNLNEVQTQLAQMKEIFKEAYDVIKQYNEDLNYDLEKSFKARIPDILSLKNKFDALRSTINSNQGEKISKFDIGMSKKTLERLYEELQSEYDAMSSNFRKAHPIIKVDEWMAPITSELYDSIEKLKKEAAGSAKEISESMEKIVEEIEKPVKKKSKKKIDIGDQLQETAQKAKSAVKELSEVNGKVKEFYDTFGSPSKALDIGYFASLEEVLKTLGGTFEEFKESEDAFDESRVNLEFFKELAKQTMLTNDEVEELQKSFSELDFLLSDEASKFSSSVSIGKQVTEELDKIQKIFNGEFFQSNPMEDFFPIGELEEDLDKAEDEVEEFSEHLTKGLSKSRNYVIDLKTAFLNLIDNIQALNSEDDPEWIERYNDDINELLSKYPELEKFKDQFSTLSDARDFIKTDAWYDFLGTLPKAREYLEEIGESDRIVASQPITINSSKNIEEEKEMVEQTGKAFDIASESKIDFVKANENVASAAENSVEPINREAEAARDLSEAFKNATDSKRQFIEVNKELANTTNNSTSSIEEAATNLVNAGLKAAATAQDSNSPSKKYDKLGKDAADGYINAIEEKTKEVAEATSDMVKGGIDSAKEISKESLSEALEEVMRRMGSTQNSSQNVFRWISENGTEAEKELFKITEGFKEFQKILREITSEKYGLFSLSRSDFDETINYYGSKIKQSSEEKRRIIMEAFGSKREEEYNDLETKREIEDIIVGETKITRLLSDIGLTREEIIKTIKEENKEIQKGNQLFHERWTLLKDGQVIDSFIGAPERTLVNLEKADEADEIIHVHPRGKNSTNPSLQDLEALKEYYSNLQNLIMIAGQKTKLFSLDELQKLYDSLLGINRVTEQTDDTVKENTDALNAESTALKNNTRQQEENNKARKIQGQVIKDVIAYRGTNGENAVSASGTTFWSDTKDNAKRYGTPGEDKTLFSALLSMQNALEIDAKGAKYGHIKYLGDGTDELSKKIIALSDHADECQKELLKLKSANEQDTEAMQRAAQVALDYSETLKEIKEISDDESNPYGTHSTDWFANWAKNNGYDGVHFKNVIDTPDAYTQEEQPSDVYVTFQENQLKNIELIEKANHKIQEQTDALNTESEALKENTKQQEENKKVRFYKDKSGQYTFIAQGKQKKKTTQTIDEPVEGQIAGQYTIDDYLKTLPTTQADWVLSLPRISKEAVQQQAELNHQIELTNTNMQRLVGLLQLTYKIREAFLRDIHMSTGEQNERLLLSGTKPVIDVEYRDVTNDAAETAKATAEATAEENAEMNDLAKTADKATTAKKKFAKANKEDAQSAKETTVEVKEENEAFDETGNSVDNLADKLKDLEKEQKGYIRVQQGRNDDVNNRYTEALSDFVDKRVTKTTDPLTGKVSTQEQYLISYDKIARKLIAIDKKRLDWIHKIENANEEQIQALQAGLIEIEDERNRLESVFNKIATNPGLYAADANQIEIVRERRRIAEVLNRSEFDAKSVGTPSINKQITTIITNMNQLKTISKDLFKGDETSIERFIRQLKNVDNLYQELITNGTQTTQTKANGAFNRAFEQLSKSIFNSKEFTQLGKGEQSYFKTIFNRSSIRDIMTLEQELNEFRRRIIDAKTELTTYKPTFFEKLGTTLKSNIGRLATTYLSITDLVRYFRQAVQAVTELDSALTELRVVSNASDYVLKDISKQAFQLGQRLGSTTAEVVKSITDWRRLGETVESSLALAEQAARLSVGGLMDVSKATESLVSAMKAYGYEVEEVSNIVDKFIYIGNNYSITSENLATSLEKSSGALVAAGNSLEQAVALEVAGNTIIQDANAVSNALKAVSMRLRGTSGSALEEIGEDTEGLVENASKLYEIVKRLTTTVSNPDGVEIINKANNSYKSTYQILLEISKVWNKIGDVQQAELLEKLAGKVRGSAVAAILSQGDILERAYYDAMNKAAGAGEQAIENSLNSIEKKTQQFKNELKNLMTDTIESDTIKGFIDFGTRVISVLDKIIPKISLLGSVLGNLGYGLAQKLLTRGSSLKEFFSFSHFFEMFDQDDWKHLNNYFAALKNGKTQVEALQTTMVGASRMATNFAKKIDANNVSLGLLSVKAKLAAQGLTLLKSVGTALLSIGFGMAINALVTYLSNLAQAEKEVVKNANELFEKYNDEIKHINDYNKEIEKLTKQLEDENITQSEAYQIRSDLYDIQQDLIKSYGVEANALDLLNNKYINTNETIKETLKNKASDILNTNYEAYNKAARELEKGKLFQFTDYEHVGHKYTFDDDHANDVWSDQEFLAILNQYGQYQEQTDLFGNKGLSFSMTVPLKNAEKELNDFSEALLKYSKKYPDLIENLRKQISKKLEKLQKDEDYQSYVNQVDEYTKALMQSTDQYYTYSDAISKYNSAIISGDSQQIQDAIDSITQYKKQVDTLIFSDKSTEDSETLRSAFTDMLDIDYSQGYRQIINNAMYDVADEASQKLIQSLMNMDGGAWAALDQLENSDNSLGFNVAKSIAMSFLKNIGLAEDAYDLFVEQFKKYINDDNKVQNNLPTNRYDWLGSLSGISLSSDGKGKTWKEIIDAYKSEMGGLEKLIKDNRSPKVKVSLEDILEVTDGSKGNQSVFKAIGMDSFTDYMDRTREYYEKLTDEEKEKFIENIGGAGSAEKYSKMAKEEQDEFIKGIQAQFSLDQFAEDAMTKLFEKFGDTENIEDMDAVKEEIMEIFNITRGGSDVIDDLITSYNELMGVYKKLKSGETLSEHEMTTLISKYGALEDAVLITSDGYKIEEDALKNLINQYVSESNTAVSAELTLTRVVLENTEKRIKSHYYEASMIDSLVKAYFRMMQSSYQYDFWGRVQQEYGDDVAADVKQIIELYEYINKLQEQFLDENTGGNELKNETKIDWIANSVKNIESAANSAKSALDRLFTTAGSSKAAENTKKLLQAHTERLRTEEDAYNKAAQSYMNEFNKLGLSNSDIKLVQNAVTTGQTGWDIRKYTSTDAETLNSAIDFWSKYLEYMEKVLDVQHQIKENDIQEIQTDVDKLTNEIARVEAQITPETSLKKQQAYTRELVTLYTEQYNKEIDIANAKGETIKAAELEAQKQQKINELVAQEIELSVDATTTRYDRILSEFDNRQRVLEHGIAMTEGRGALVSSNYYKALIDNEKATMQAGLKEREKLIKDLNALELKGINSKEDLELWWKTKNAIDECTSSLYDSEEAVLEWKKAIRSNEWTVFDRIQDTISRVGSEADYLINAMSNKDLFAYTKELWSNDGSQTKVFYGDMTNQGLATLGLHQLKVAEFKEQVEDYRKEIQQLYKDIADNPTDLELIDRKNELIDKERELALAVRQEQDAIIDLIRDGYDKQLNSLQELIDKYTQAISEEHELYKTQKEMAKKTKDLNNIRRQIAAYANDTSEEARSKIQQLTVQLKDAEEDMQETQYQRYLDDQQKILDRLYNNFETYVTNRLDDRDTLLAEVSTKVDDNKKEIKKTLREEGEELGTGITTTMKGLWGAKNDWSSIGDSITQRDGRLKELKDSITGTDNSLTAYLQNYFGNDKTNNVTSKLSSILAEIEKLNTNLGQYLDVNDEKTGTIETTKQTITNPTVKSKGYYEGFDANDFVGGTTHNGIDKFDQKVIDAYNSMVGKNGALSKVYGTYIGSKEQLEAMYRFLKNRGYYASGKRRLLDDELAWTQENGLEAIIRQSDGAILTPLAHNDSVLNATATQNLWDMANNPLQFIKENSAIPNLPTRINGGDYDIQQSMVITLPNVMNYPEFVSQLQKDKKFEQMMQDMTINKLTGGSQLAKYKYKY